MAKVQLSKKERITRRRRRRRQLIGLLFAGLFCIGLGTVVVGGVQLVRGFFSNDMEIEDFIVLIRPLVEMDPTSFSSIDKANPDILREAAIWAALEYEGKEKYYDEQEQKTLVPAVDVEIYAAKMYGPSYVMEHKSFTRMGVAYEYNSVTNTYFVPIAASRTEVYTPEIVSITSKKNTKVLLVAYIMNNEVKKHQEYVMIRGANGYYLFSIRDVVE